MIIDRATGKDHARGARLAASMSFGTLVIYWTRDTLPTLAAEALPTATAQDWVALAAARQAAARKRRPRTMGQRMPHRRRVVVRVSGHDGDYIATVWEDQAALGHDEDILAVAQNPVRV